MLPNTNPWWSDSPTWRQDIENHKFYATWPPGWYLQWHVVGAILKTHSVISLQHLRPLGPKTSLFLNIIHPFSAGTYSIIFRSCFPCSDLSWFILCFKLSMNFSLKQWQKFAWSTATSRSFFQRSKVQQEAALFETVGIQKLRQLLSYRVRFLAVLDDFLDQTDLGGNENDQTTMDHLLTVISYKSCWINDV